MALREKDKHPRLSTQHMQRPKGGEDREGSRRFGVLLFPGEERQGRATVRNRRTHRVNDTHVKALSLVIYLGHNATSVQEVIKRL